MRDEWDEECEMNEKKRARWVRRRVRDEYWESKRDEEWVGLYERKTENGC